jgi:hypothetical protein
MTSQDPLANRFRAPTPPPGVDDAVLNAAGRQAARMAQGRLSKKAEKSYSSETGPTEDSRESTMSDTIVFPCPACGTKYSVSPSHAGKKTTCKKCSAQITVPSPEIANPTIIGQTRTIRRADIARQSARKTTGTIPAPSVDMEGGASVMRKEETVAGVPATAPGLSARAHAPRRTAAAFSGRMAQPAPHGRPAQQHGHGRPYGMPPGQKKSSLPLVLGIAGGAVGLILVVVLILVFTAPPGPAPLPQQDGGGTPVAEDPKVRADKRLLDQMRNSVNNASSLSLDDVKRFYEEAKQRKENPDFKLMQNSWALQLQTKVESADPRTHAAVALLLKEDGYPSAEHLLKSALDALKKGDLSHKTVTVEENGRRRNTIVVDKTFEKIARMVGWDSYERPAIMDEYSALAIDGTKEYDRYLFDVDPVYRDTKLFPPDLLKELRRLEAIAMKNGEAAFKQHEEDGYWKNTRRAWLRFKGTNDTKGASNDKNNLWNRAKRRRPFCQLAMRRDNEEFDDVWTYTYYDPFILYVEKPLGGAARSTKFKEALDSKAALIKDLNIWFDKHFIEPMKLERVKPMDNAKLAAEEGWPLNIIVFKDEATFNQFWEDEHGSPNPGARAYYSPVNEVVITYDEETVDPDTAWFNESVLIHETFHMLSDFYASKPIDFSKFDAGERPERPRYSNLLIQEGITDSVAGFIRGGGAGRDATYEFLQLNHLRLQNWQQLYHGIMGGHNPFPIKDMLECTVYPQLIGKLRERMTAVGSKFPLSRVNLQVAMGLFYPTACQASYFFHHYQEGGKYVYRDKWWEYLKLDYTGELELPSYFNTT